MVTCTKCGRENDEAAKFCVSCGAVLRPEKETKGLEETCFGPERRKEEECFGLPYGGTIAGIVFGIFVVLIGLGIFLGQDIGRLIGPFAVIIVGILIVAGAIYSLRRKPGR